MQNLPRLLDTEKLQVGDRFSFSEDVTGWTTYGLDGFETIGGYHLHAKEQIKEKWLGREKTFEKGLVLTVEKAYRTLFNQWCVEAAVDKKSPQVSFIQEEDNHLIVKEQKPH